MEAPQAADGQNRPVQEHFGASCERSFSLLFPLPVSVQNPETRPATRARVRLGVVPPVGRSVILLQAGRTLGKGIHARAYPVVWHGLDDREPRSTIGASDEGVPVPPILGIEKLPLAGRTDRHVGADREAALPSRSARYHLEGVDLTWHPRDHVQRVDACKGRRVVPEVLHELPEAVRRPFDLDPDFP